MALDLAERLASLDAFSGLPTTALARVAGIAVPKRYAAGDPIIRKGDHGEDIFVVHSGEVFATVPDGRGQMMRDPMSEGSVFGEMALLTGEVRSADVTAATECVCLTIPFNRFNALMARHPAVAGFLTTLVGSRLVRRDGIRRVADYEIDGPLGSGGFARVFRVRHAETGETAAVKMLRHALVHRQEFAEQFRGEAGMIQGLVHPSIVRVHDVVSAYATLFIVMEFIDGLDLDTLLEARTRLAPRQVRFIVRELAGALQHAHECGIIHRDVKPSNVIVTRAGQVKLVDFGVATVSDADVETESTEDFFGTPAYAAPEHLLGDTVTARTDIYMLGITAFELATGELPFRSNDLESAAAQHLCRPLPDPREIAEVPDDVFDFIVRATQKDPDDRFESCAEVVSFFDACDDVSNTLSEAGPIGVTGAHRRIRGAEAEGVEAGDERGSGGRP